MTAETIIATASTVIALCAFFFSIWQAKIVRDHNKISVKPHLVNWSESHLDSGIFEYFIFNNGIGPAIITRFEIRLDEEVISGKGTEPIKKVIERLFPNELVGSGQAFMAPGFALGAKEKCRILWLRFRKETTMTKEQIEAKLNRADLIVEYESFYGEKEKLDTRT